MGQLLSFYLIEKCASKSPKSNFYMKSKINREFPRISDNSHNLLDGFWNDLLSIMFHSRWHGNFLKMFPNQPCARLEEECRLRFTLSESAEQLSEDIFLELLHHGLSKSALMCRFACSTFDSEEEMDTINKAEQVQRLGKKVYAATHVRRGASLVGAGLGAMIFRPTAGQWIGCTIGDLARPVIVSF